MRKIYITIISLQRIIKKKTSGREEGNFCDAGQGGPFEAKGG